MKQHRLLLVALLALLILYFLTYLWARQHLPALLPAR